MRRRTSVDSEKYDLICNCGGQLQGVSHNPDVIGAGREERILGSRIDRSKCEPAIHGIGVRDSPSRAGCNGNLKRSPWNDSANHALREADCGCRGRVAAPGDGHEAGEIRGSSCRAIASVARNSLRLEPKRDVLPRARFSEFNSVIVHGTSTAHKRVQPPILSKRSRRQCLVIDLQRIRRAIATRKNETPGPIGLLGDGSRKLIRPGESPSGRRDGPAQQKILPR